MRLGSHQSSSLGMITASMIGECNHLAYLTHAVMNLDGRRYRVVDRAGVEIVLHTTEYRELVYHGKHRSSD
jgi:hypothetical protein